MNTDISEKGLETLIMRHMTGTDGRAPAREVAIAETPDFLAAAKTAGSGWIFSLTMWDAPLPTLAGGLQKQHS